MELNTEALLAVPIQDNEIFELLERLAATEEMFKTPVSTIRDVVELTEASPTLVARLLGEMRGPGELEQMVGRLDEHDRRLLEVEHKFSKLEKQKASTPPEVRVNRPNIVGSTIESARATKLEETPPKAWVDSKRKIAYEREKEIQKRWDKAQSRLIMSFVFFALAGTVLWLIFSSAPSH